MVAAAAATAAVVLVGVGGGVGFIIIIVVIVAVGRRPRRRTSVTLSLLHSFCLLRGPERLLLSCLSVCLPLCVHGGCFGVCGDADLFKEHAACVGRRDLPVR
jgi:hypothetical protein